jgi:hypothetical protein
MKPSAYISDGGILFKESPPDSILKLSPLYTSAEIQELHNLVKEQPIVKVQPMRELTEDEIKEIYDQYFDLESFGWLQLECIREILQKAGEK